MARQLVKFTKLPDGNLRIELLPDARGEVEEIYWDPSLDANDMFYEVVEYQLCNSDWEFVRPEEIGALTAANILSDEVERDNQGNLTKIGKVYWHKQYELYVEIEELLEQGYVDFTLGEEG